MDSKYITEEGYCKLCNRFVIWQKEDGWFCIFCHKLEDFVDNNNFMETKNYIIKLNLKYDYLYEEHSLYINYLNNYKEINNEIIKKIHELNNEIHELNNEIVVLKDNIYTLRDIIFSYKVKELLDNLTNIKKRHKLKN